MKKAILIWVLWGMAWMNGMSQLAPGSIAPDFVANDVNGQSWHLYDLLDQGKIVLLEISATWCPPCWVYHNSSAMYNFYNQHGPQGDDRAKVLFVEGDAATNTACLFGVGGCNNSTPGNWVSGTPYPMIDNAAIAASYAIEYYPTIFVICPNKKLYEVPQLGANELWARAVTCPVASGANNAGIFAYDPGSELHEICDTVPVQPNLKLINLGSQALTQATLLLKWNGTVVDTFAWTGYLPLYGEADVTFDTLPIAEAGTLTTSIATVNGNFGDDDLNNNERNNNFTLAATFDHPKILLKIRTDGYGEEVYWEVRNEMGEVMEHGGNDEVGPNGGGVIYAPPSSTAYPDNTTIKDTLNLPGPGCYSIHFVDAYGDGICCNFGNGYYRLYNLDMPGTPILSGGQFAAYENRGWGAEFQISAAEEAQASPMQANVFPNPAHDVLNIEYYLSVSAAFQARIMDANGRVMYDSPFGQQVAGEHLETIDIAQWPQGLYVLHLQANGVQEVRKFVVLD
jgi:hypothetical protein